MGCVLPPSWEWAGVSRPSPPALPGRQPHHRGPIENWSWTPPSATGMPPFHSIAAYLGTFGIPNSRAASARHQELEHLGPGAAGMFVGSHAALLTTLCRFKSAALSQRPSPYRKCGQEPQRSHSPNAVQHEPSRYNHTGYRGSVAAESNI